MSGNSAQSGSWAMHNPPTALIACAPALPFVLVPARTAAIACRHAAVDRCGAEECSQGAPGGLGPATARSP